MIEKKTTTRKRKPKGLGDTVENVLKVTRVDKIAKFVLGEDCKCDERKEKLNKLFPYFKPNCLTEDEYNYLTTFFETLRGSIKPSDQSILIAIYNRALNQKQEPTTCSDCWRDIINKIRTLYDAYEVN